MTFTFLGYAKDPHGMWHKILTADGRHIRAACHPDQIVSGHIVGGPCVDPMPPDARMCDACTGRLDDDPSPRSGQR